MNEDSKALEIAHKMLEHDAFSKWLGVELIEMRAGYCLLKMTIRQEMLNGFYIAHGGITFSLADSAFAFASNSRGRHAVSIHCEINHLQALKAEEVILAEASEEHLNHKIAVYNVRVVKEDKELVASFKGTVYRKSNEWSI